MAHAEVPKCIDELQEEKEQSNSSKLWFQVTISGRILPVMSFLGIGEENTKEKTFLRWTHESLIYSLIFYNVQKSLLKCKHNIPTKKTAVLISIYHSSQKVPKSTHRLEEKNVDPEDVKNSFH